MKCSECKFWETVQHTEAGKYCKEHQIFVNDSSTMTCFVAKKNRRKKVMFKIKNKE
jgi:hypothetical protein